MLSSPAQYLPFLNGKYDTKPNLFPLNQDFGNGELDTLIFQIDDSFHKYRLNKLQCCQENLDKYYQSNLLQIETEQIINNFLIQKLSSDYPQFFTLNDNQLHCPLTQENLSWDNNYQLKNQTSYTSLLDALVNQIQEDLAIIQLTDKDDKLAAIHLCSPNYWSPAEKIGKNFSAIHQPVAGMEKIRQRYRPMLESIVKKNNSYVRFAWGLTTDNRLNHHPKAPVHIPQEEWAGRSFDPKHPELFIRVERQTLTGFPEVNAFLFTIRTYFEDVTNLNSSELIQLQQALLSMSQETLVYKGLKQDAPSILNYVSSLL